jgi:hypothetical protein
LLAPVGGARDDQLTAHQLATLVTVLVNVNRGKKGGRRKFKPADFLPLWGTKRRGAQDPREQLQIVDALIAQVRHSKRRR